MAESKSISTPKGNGLATALAKNRSSDVLILLIDLLEEITHCSGFDELLKQVAGAAKKLMSAEASSLMLLDRPGKYLTIVMPTGPVKSEIKNKKIRAGRGYAGWAVKNKKPIIAQDVQKSDVFGGEISGTFTTSNLICVPLIDDDEKIMGVLQALNRTDDEPFRESDIPVFQTFANHVANAIQRIRRRNKISRLKNEHHIIFKEIHHRVKNDFALISGIVEMGSVNVEDPDAQKIMDDIQSRIQTMAVVYDLLNNEEQKPEVSACAYFNELIDKISANAFEASGDIRINLDVARFSINSKLALTCGLILNELLTNSCKHAFSADLSNEITISISEKEEKIQLIYRDNGKGLPDGLESSDQDSLGLGLIRALVNQIDGSLTFSNDEGALFFIEFDVQGE